MPELTAVNFFISQSKRLILIQKQLIGAMWNIHQRCSNWLDQDAMLMTTQRAIPVRMYGAGQGGEWQLAPAVNMRC